jgi:hypothetical protein
MRWSLAIEKIAISGAYIQNRFLPSFMAPLKSHPKISNEGEGPLNKAKIPAFDIGHSAFIIFGFWIMHGSFFKCGYLRTTANPMYTRSIPW